MNIFLSFLGRGAYNKEQQRHVYTPTRYRLDRGDRSTGENKAEISQETPYVQAAEIELLGGHNYDKVVIVMTPTSRREQFDGLLQSLQGRGAKSVLPMIIDEDSYSAQAQWQWFEAILSVVEPRSHLTVDLTHGMRMVPILFSIAIHFLQRAKEVVLDAAFYGAFEAPGDIKPIIDLKEFFSINVWAEAVGRLVDEADAGHLARAADVSPGFQAGVLVDAGLRETLTELTAAIKNVEIHGVGGKAKEALDRLENARGGAKSVDRLLLDLVVDKFTDLVGSIGDRYDRNYFDVQFAFIRLLAEHRLYMQCFTALWEMIGTIGLVGLGDVPVRSNQGRKKRHSYGEAFKAMVQFPQEQWVFPLQRAEHVEKLRPYYDRLKANNFLDGLRGVAVELVKLRNGFDHAWCATGCGAPPDLPEWVELFCRKLEKISCALLDGRAAHAEGSALPARMPLVFSHVPTPEQEAEARARWGVAEFAHLPPELQARWSQIAPDELAPWPSLEPIVQWALENSWVGGPILVQGDFGATTYVVCRLQEMERVPVYATTRREAVETFTPDGDVRTEHVFRHVFFRGYPKCQK